MLHYELVSQKVDVVLDFKQYTLQGSTHLNIKLVNTPGNDTIKEDNKSYMLPIVLPIIGSALYKRVLVNDVDVRYQILKATTPNLKSDIIDKSCKNVDLLTYEGLHLASKSLFDSFLYVEVDPTSTSLRLDIYFRYYQLDGTNSEVYFEKHWILPRGAANYREYVLFTSSSLSNCWFPTMFHKSYSTVYEFNITVPIGYSVICGVNMLDFGECEESLTNRTFRFTSERRRTMFYSVERDTEEPTPPQTSNVTDDLTAIADISRSFGIFVGEFDFWDGMRSRRIDPEFKDEEIDEEMDDDIAHLTDGTTFELPRNSSLIYVTLKGFGYLLESTNITTNLCIDTFKRIMDVEYPSPLYLLFLPNRSFNNSINMSCAIKSQNYADNKRCSSYTSSENYLHSSFLNSLTQFYYHMYYKSGDNILVYSLDCLHSFTDIHHDPKCIDKRIVIASGLTLVFDTFNDNPCTDLHLDLILQSYLVDQFVKRTLGHTEFKVRLWSKRELFATLVEIFGDLYPLCMTDEIRDPMTERSGKRKDKGSKQKHKTVSFTSKEVLMSNPAFLLKCQLFPNVLESLFSSYKFLPEGFLIYLLRKWIDKDRIYESSSPMEITVINGVSGNGSKEEGADNVLDNSGTVSGITGKTKKKTSDKQSKRRSHRLSGSEFWSMVIDEIVLRYILAWNAKPQNRLSLDSQLKTNMTLNDILKHGVEHEQLNSLMTNLNNLIKSYIYGTGCPQVTMGFVLQLQRKGTSMDHLAFRVDVNPLQPPLNIDENGKTMYSLCKIAGMSASNLLTAYTRLGRIMQLDLNCQDYDDMVFRRVMDIYGIYGDDNCPTFQHVLEFGDITDSLGFITFSEVGQLRKNLALYQIWHDPVDLVGRDGNFMMGFGYIGAHALKFCLGNGQLWDCVEGLKQSCDINKIVETLVDNGTSYCGVFIHSDNVKRQYNRGRLPIALSGGFPYWKLIYQQKMLLDLRGDIPLSGGFAKKWIFPFVADIVEDDGIRENVKYVGELVPISYKVNPRAKRGRKKVALKGAAEDIETVDESTSKNLYIGQYSESDRMVIEWMKMLFLGIHPEMTQLDNRSVVAKVCSKTRLPLLWIRLDSNFTLIARIRRCQSSGMWEQQLTSDNNIFSQMEAAAALGSFGRSEQFVVSENPLLESAALKLEQMIRRHKSHPSIRARCVYSLVCLHNRDFRQNKNIQAIFSKYLSSFSLNSSSVNQWHPSEARFMIDFFKALALLRDRQGYTPQMVVDVFSTVLENMNGKNFLVHATNIVECCSYLSLPYCILHRMGLVTGKRDARCNVAKSTDGVTGGVFEPQLTSQLINSGNVNVSTATNNIGSQSFSYPTSVVSVVQMTPTCISIESMWNLLWHLFRLDGIPGSCSSNRMLTSAFLMCISRQPVLLSLCYSKFETEKDLGFEFDYVYFLPLLQHIHLENQVIFELGQTYNSRNVHRAALWSIIYCVLTSTLEMKLEEKETKRKRNDNDDESYDNAEMIISFIKLSYQERIQRLSIGIGVLNAMKAIDTLYKALDDWDLKLYLWDALSEILTETSHSLPVIYMDMENDYMKEARNVLLLYLKTSSLSTYPFYIKLFVKVHQATSLLFGFGCNWNDDPAPDNTLSKLYVEDQRSISLWGDTDSLG